MTHPSSFEPILPVVCLLLALLAVPLAIVYRRFRNQPFIPDEFTMNHLVWLAALSAGALLFISILGAALEAAAADILTPEANGSGGYWRLVLGQISVQAAHQSWRILLLGAPVSIALWLLGEEPRPMRWMQRFAVVCTWPLVAAIGGAIFGGHGAIADGVETIAIVITPIGFLWGRRRLNSRRPVVAVPSTAPTFDVAHAETRSSPMPAIWAYATRGVRAEQVPTIQLHDFERTPTHVDPPVLTLRGQPIQPQGEED